MVKKLYTSRKTYTMLNPSQTSIPRPCNPAKHIKINTIEVKRTSKNDI